MRKTSFGLGLAGTIIAFLCGIIMLFAGIFTTSLRSVEWDEISDIDGLDIEVYEDDFHFSANTNIDDASDMVSWAVGLAGAYLIVAAICSIIAGILGIIGSVIAGKRKSVGAGIMLLIAAVLSIPSLWGLNATVLLIPAGILAFLNDKNKQQTISEVDPI